LLPTKWTTSKNTIISSIVYLKHDLGMSETNLA